MTQNTLSRRRFLGTASAGAITSSFAGIPVLLHADGKNESNSSFRGQHMRKIRVASVSTFNYIGEQERSLRNIAQWSRRAAREGAELVVFPELSVSGYVQHEVVWELAESVPGPSTEYLANLAGELGIVLCCGILERDADVTFNTQVLVNGNGLIGKQRKVHMPGMEYLYWRAAFEVNTFDIGKIRVGIMICYDSLFFELARTLYYKGAEALIMPFAYYTDPHRSRFPEENMTALVYRSQCYSNACYGILCNNAGGRDKNKYEPEGIKFPGWAGIFGPDGDVVEFTRGEGTGEAMAVATLEPERVARRRRNGLFIPRILRPELYYYLNDGDQSGI